MQYEKRQLVFKDWNFEILFFMFGIGYDINTSVEKKFLFSMKKYPGRPVLPKRLWVESRQFVMKHWKNKNQILRILSPFKTIKLLKMNKVLIAVIRR